MGDPNDPDDPIHPDDPIEVDLPKDTDRDTPEPTWDTSDTLPEGVDYVGSYKSIADYLRAMLEPEVSRACAWLLDHVDYEAVQRRWESDGSRLMIEHGHIYRIANSRPEIPM